MRGTGSVYKPSDREVWWIKYFTRGRAFSESSGSRNRKDAEKLLRRRLKEVGADDLGLRPFIGPDGDRITVSDLIDEAIRAYCLKRGLPFGSAPAWIKTRQQTLLAHIGHLQANLLEERDIAAYIDKRRKDGMAAATVNRETELLRRGLRLALEARKISWIPKVPRLKEQNVRRGFFENDEFESVVGQLSDAFQDFARFGYWTGMRRGEIASLEWSDVDRAARVLRLRPENSKTGEGRVIPLVDELWSILDRRWEGRVFETHQGAKISHWVFHREGCQVIYKSFDRAWDNARRKAGLPKVLFHDLRRTAVRNMVRAGVRESVAMRISGHKTRSIFDRYNIVDERDLAEALEKTMEHVRSRAPRARVQVMSESKNR